MSCGVVCRRGSHLALLWCRPAAVAALIEPLAWELPCAAGVALKKKKKKEGVVTGAFFEIHLQGKRVI